MKPIRLRITEQNSDDDAFHDFEITVDDEGRAEIRNARRQGVAQRDTSVGLVVGNQPMLVGLSLAVEVAP